MASFLMLLSMLSAALGGLLLFIAKSSIYEMAGLIAFLIAAVLLSGGAIVNALKDVEHQIKIT